MDLLEIGMDWLLDLIFEVLMALRSGYYRSDKPNLKISSSAKPLSFLMEEIILVGERGGGGTRSKLKVFPLDRVWKYRLFKTILAKMVFY